MPHLPTPHHNLNQATKLPDLIFSLLFSTKSNPKPKPISLKMSSNPNNNPNRQNFPNPQALTDWLKPRLPSSSLSTWGVHPGTKNVHNLWLELTAGETTLTDSTPPIRTVHVVTVRILNPKNHLLIESHQLLTNDTTRPRNQPLSEKMKPGESVEVAVTRAMKEELGSVYADVAKVDWGTYKERVEERVSNSYPGLPARYVLHTVDARVEGLPEGEFWTEESEEYGEVEERSVAEKAVGVKCHYWKWVAVDAAAANADGDGDADKV